MGHFCPPGSGTRSGSGSTHPIESGSNPDPDPQPCWYRSLQGYNECINSINHWTCRKPWKNPLINELVIGQTTTKQPFTMSKTQSIRKLLCFKITSEYWLIGSAPTQLVQHLAQRRSSNRRIVAGSHTFNMVWLYRSPLAVGGGVSLLKFSLPAFAAAS